MKIKKYAKSEVLKGEGDAYFDRNLRNGKIEIAKGCILFGEFLDNYTGLEKNIKILEIGCCYGYNLAYLCKRYGFEGFGVEPSEKAIAYGRKLLAEEKEIKVVLKQGTVDSLPFESEYFDIVIMAFCMYMVDRKSVMRAISEADRVLKCGGVLAIWDFDTKIPYWRENVHSESLPTFKCDFTKIFLANPQYYLVEKRPFSIKNSAFHKDIQERCALNVLYKETIEDSYIFRS